MSGARPLLVDAHNVLHQDPALRRLLPDPERARRALELRLSGRQAVWLFYDGGPGGEPANALRGGLHLDYSGAGEADDRLVAWLRDHPDCGATVVSDDRALRARARALGARLCAVSEFLAGLPAARRAPPEKPTSVDAAELRLWLREFGAEDELTD